MAFFNKFGSVLKQSNSLSSVMNGQSSMLNAIRCMSSKLFIGGLSYGTDDQSLRGAFSCFGDVTDAKVIIDRDSGRSRGFGFVSYSSDDSASAALSAMDGKELNGRNIRVSYAQERAPRSSFNSGGGYNWDVVPAYLPAMYSVCSGITSLNLSYATIQSPDLVKFVSQCRHLQCLWVLDYIEDTGLEALAASCKDLQELRVFPSDLFGADANVSLTEQGLVSVSEGCPKLQSVLYFCQQMSNSALVTIARNRPEMIRFRLCIIEPHTPDYLTLEPLDTGFGAIVENCKDLRRLSLSGLLTDRVFEYIGKHGKKLEMLSIAFAGDSDLGLHHVLSGCESLRKLEIRDCPFGDKALTANAAKLETMRSLWMSSCLVSFGACKLLAQKMPRLNVEVIDERGPPNSRPDSCPVEKLYIYRSVGGRRVDKPNFVWTMGEDADNPEGFLSNGAV